MQLNWFSSTNTSMLGIDIGSHSIKAVLLASELPHRLLAYAIKPLPHQLFIDRELQDVEILQHHLQQLFQQLGEPLKKVNYAAIALSGPSVISKIIYMDKALSDLELEEQIRIEADNLIPYPLNEISLDFEIIGINAQDPSKHEVLLSASRTETIQARVSAFEQTRLVPKVVDVESYALSRAYELLQHQLPSLDNQLVGLIDIGAQTSMLSVLKKGQVIYNRDQNFGGEQCTQGIMNLYDQTRDQAEQTKIIGPYPDNFQQDVMTPFIHLISQHIRKQIQLFSNATEYDSLDYLLLSGGCAYLNDFAPSIEQALGIPVQIAKPLSGITQDPTIDLSMLLKQQPQLVIATGLALRSFNSCHL